MQKTKKSTLDQWLARKKKPAIAGIQPMPADTPAPLSHGQERLWLLQQLQPENPFYQYAHAYRFRGKLNIEILIASFQKVVERHAVLRTNFIQTENGVQQVVHSHLSLPVEQIDLRALAAAEQQIRIENHIVDKVKATFSLEKDPLLRLSILQLKNDEWLVFLAIHHIIGDRWSLQVLQDEVASSYRSAVKQLADTKPLSPLTIQYADYAYWQRKQPQRQADLDYWLKKLAGDLPVLQLPADRSRPNRASFKGASLSRSLSRDLSDQIKAFSKQHNTTAFAFTLTVYQILLYRLSAQTDLRIGVPFTNRDQKVLEKLFGFFNETLVLRADLAQDLTFSELLSQTKENVATAFQHKNTAFETLVKELKPTRLGSENPLFQAMFLYNAPQPLPEFSEEVQVEEEVVDLGVAKFDLTLFVNDDGEQLTTTFEYATDLFEQTTIERWQGHFSVLLEHILAHPQQTIRTLPILSTAEQQTILQDWNNTKQSIPKGYILSLFDQQAKQEPTSICVVDQEKKLSYEEVKTLAERVAFQLRQRGIGNGDIVGLHAQRSVHLLIGIIGILKAGGTYLPLDPDYPQERTAYILKDAGAKLVLSQRAIVADLPADLEVLTFEEAVSHDALFTEVEIAEQQLAYLIYTSGSTGKPKGVPISHHNLLVSTAARFSFYERMPTAFLLMSSFAFDSSVAGIFWTITTGGTLVIPPKRIEQDIEQLAQIIHKNQVSHTLLLPSLYHLLLQHAPAEQLQSLTTVMVAGEACLPKVVNQHFTTLPDTHLYNEYGPTEGTVWCTAQRVEPISAAGSVPIGRPIPNVENYILDANQQPVPIGVAGELYIGGATLASGYWQRPELTAERFIEWKIAGRAAKRLYRTGDLVSYRSDGTIEFLGRVDRQVKIRGYRIEPDEIRSLLLQQSGVQDAIIKVETEGSN
ncbi:MAG: amino acid adenylation domain-containing protein, partial [Saprospiraceae bacterium]